MGGNTNYAPLRSYEKLLTETDKLTFESHVKSTDMSNLQVNCMSKLLYMIFNF